VFSVKERRLRFFSAQQAADQEDDAEQDVDNVIHFPEHQQGPDAEHVIGARPQEPSGHAQQQVDDTEDEAEPFRPAGGSGEAKVQSDRSGHNMHKVVNRRKVRTQKRRRDESRDSDQYKYDTEDLANSLCHDLCCSS